MINRTIGSVFILIGSAIGAGMLALPLVGAAAGFYFSTILLILIWLLMTFTALLTLEINLAFKPYENSFGTMAKATLGRPGQIITWLSYLLLLYATTAAYIDGSTSLLGLVLTRFMHIKIPLYINIIAITLVFGTIVFLGTRLVDFFMRSLLSIKGILLIIGIAVLIPYVDVSKLAHQESSLKYLAIAAPIFLNAFGFHFVIPSIANYSSRRPKILQWVIITASTIPLIIYIFWLFVTFGIVPLHGDLSFATIAHTNSTVGGLVQTLVTLARSKTTLVCVNLFADIAMTTSFLGVALGLFDFLADGFKRSNAYTGRFQTALLTFIPPLIFALFYQHGFLLALEYSAIFAVILEIFLPALMVYQLRRSNQLHSPYRVPCNSKLMLVLLMGVGCLLMFLVIADRMHLLPVLM